MWDEPDLPQGQPPRWGRNPNPTPYSAQNDPSLTWDLPEPNVAPSRRTPYEPATDPYEQPPTYKPPIFPPAPAYQPPTYPLNPQPQRPQYPGGRPPQWPGPQAQPPKPAYSAPMPEAYPDAPRSNRRSPTWEDREAPSAAPRYAPPRERQQERRSHPRAYHALPRLPIAHVFLLAGLVAMAYAITRAWAVDTTGMPIFVQNFTNARISGSTGVDTGALASQIAIGIVVISAILSAALILVNTVVTVMNRLLGVIGLSGCASMLLFPVLWGAGTLLFVALLAGAGFAGVGKLSALPIIQAHDLSLVNVSHYASGFYLWCGGLVAVFIGMLGELALRRR